VSKSIDEETNKVKKNQKTLRKQNDKINDIIQSCDPKDMLCVSDTFLKSLETDIKPINNSLPTAADKAFSKSRISFLVFLKFVCSWSFIFPRSSSPLICN
jgi:DNA repair exonuclease SbcCD ATPase subunit